MLETLLVLGLLAALVVGGVVAVVVSWQALVVGGLVLVGIGSVLGIPTGVWYHVALYRCLAPRGELPSGWWVSPVRFHVHLREEEQPEVMRWFFLGGFGFMVMMVGCFVLMLGVLMTP